MELKIKISEGKYDNISTEGDAELKLLTSSFVEAVLDEASRLEISQRTSKGKPEITASIINNANDSIRKFAIKPTKPNWVIWVRISAFVSALLVGVFGSHADFINIWQLLVFCTILIISVVLNVILISKEY